MSICIENLYFLPVHIRYYSWKSQILLLFFSTKQFQFLYYYFFLNHFLEFFPTFLWVLINFHSINIFCPNFHLNFFKFPDFSIKSNHQYSCNIWYFNTFPCSIGFRVSSKITRMSWYLIFVNLLELGWLLKQCS